MSSARVRLAFFFVGLVLIIFGGIGLLFHAPWGDITGSLFAIFGTTASFAQFSIGFSSLKPADSAAPTAPPAPYPTSAPPGYAVPGPLPASWPQQPQPAKYAPPGAPYSPAQSSPKTYPLSGTALLLTSVGTLVYLVLTLLGGASPTRDQFALENGVFVLTYAFALCGIRAIHLKQAPRAGWPGIIGILMLTAGWALNVLVGGIVVAAVLFKTFFPPETVVAFNTLLGVNYFFIIVGDVILGLSIFRAAIFPRWTGVAFIAIGCAELIVTLIPVLGLLQLAVVALAIVMFAQLGYTLLKPSPAFPLAPAAPAGYGAPVPVGTRVPAAPAMYGVPAAAPPAPVYAPPPPAPAAPPHERPMFCPQCRTPQAPGARVCPRCGFNFSQAPAQMQREKTPPAAASPQELPEKTVLKPQPIVAGPQGVFTLPAGRQVFITAAGAMVGRGSLSGPDAVDVDLTSEAEKATVSRHHARVTWSEGHFEIEDLKSANQTRLNNQTLAPGQRYPLHNGDVVDFGSVRCRFTLHGS